MAHRLDETLRKGTVMSAKKLAPKKALWAGLTVAAPDGGSWIAGVDAYDASQNRGETLEESYVAALNAAAPNGGTWLDGQREIYNSLSGKPVGHVGNRDAASAATRRVADWVSSAFAKREPAQHS